MAAPSPARLIACDLPQAWAGQDSWRILDTAFGDGSLLMDLWQTWALDPKAPPALHVVAICAVAPSIDGVLRSLAARPALHDRADELERQWFGLLPGFHRIELHDGRLRLTLCIGPQHAMLRELQFEADSVFLRAPADPARPDAAAAPMQWDKHSVKAVTRLCHRGTGMAIDTAPGLPSEVCAQAGIVPAPNLGSGAIVQACRYQPHWQIATTRSVWRRAPAGAGECVVVGAGLAGATMAYALARRGWQVTVLDAATGPAAGASGLPVGLLAPQVSRDDNLRSRLARAGIRLSLMRSSHLLKKGHDWDWTGVAELDPQGRNALPRDWPEQGQRWSHANLAHAPTHRSRLGTAADEDGIWHATGGWIKPAALVLACLAHPAIRFVARKAVHAITHATGRWQARDHTGAVLAQAAQMVLACAGDVARLTSLLAPSQAAVQLPLSPVKGQVSWAMHKPGDTNLFPPFAVNGAGSAIAHVPQADTRTAWFVGATYEAPADAAIEALAAATVDPQPAHTENFGRLASLLPDAAAQLAPDFASGAVHAWRGTRWTTADRLPVAGALSADRLPGLWVSAAMGSRGLTYAVLCAEIVAAQLGAEPSPIEARLLKCLRPSRFASYDL